MKKAFAFFTLLLGLISMFAQSGPTFPYQAVVRNSQNQLIKDSTFAIDVEVYQATELKYKETQSVTTNANGQFTMNIGGGTVMSGAMNDIADWSVAKFKLTYHLSEGDIVSENAVSPVPYALQAANVAESAGLDCADVKTCIADTLTHYTTTTALEQLLQQISARMDSLDHIVDSLSHQPCGASFTCGTDSVKDIDNNWYHTVPFGNQCWLKENLRTTKYADNTPIENGTSSSTDTPYWYYPNNDASNKSSYGLLYNWKAVMNGASTTNDNPSGVQGICPSGWHVPSDAEWTQLTRFVKSQPAYVCAGCSGSDNDSFTYCIAKALASTTGWNSYSETCVVGDTTRSNNATGFSAMPAGYYDGNYSFFSSYTCFWSTTEDFNSYSYGRAILTYNNYVDRQFYNEASGFSVRCVRNADAGGNTPSTPATMSCEDVMNCLGDTLDRLNARITSQGETIAAQGAEIETLNSTVTTQGETIAAQGETITAQGNTIDSLNHVVDSLSNLNHGGGPAAFTCGTSKVKDVENNEYNTVRIGSQCWMAQNLRTKTHQYGNVWTKTDADSAIYGRYYDWAAVMQGESGSTVQGICPAGWHVPSDAEWDTLTTYVSSVEAYKCNSSIASALSDSTGWKSSSICCAGDNSSATINITGFAAVPAGSFTDGFGGFGDDAYFWSATEYNNQMALCQSLHSHATGVSSYEDYKSHCYSVRCVRNADAGGDTPATPPTMSCEDVMNCLGDTLDHLNARITSQSAEIETLNGTVTSQANTIDSLTHIVNSLSDPTPDTPAGDTTAVPFNCGTDKLKDVDSNEYSTIKIGNQCWMKENLRTVTSHCGRVMNANDICLYDWAAAMQVSGANATTITVGVKHQGICPSGWHVPSDADWDALTTYVYNSTNPDYKCSGCNQGPGWEQDTRCIAKALSSTTGWNTSSNSCAVGNSPEDNDATGFSAVPAGAYYGESLGVTNVGTGAYMWSSTQKGDGSAWYRLLGCGNSRVVRSSSNKGICYSVRCLKNN